MYNFYYNNNNRYYYCYNKNYTYFKKNKYLLNSD